MAVESRPHAILVHGWNDDPTRGWLGWLSSELADRGYEVAAPHFLMNRTSAHRLDSWRDELTSILQSAPSNSILIAHSLGCWLALRSIEALSETNIVSRMILIAGFYDAPQAEAEPYFSPEPSWTHIKSRVVHRTCLYSNDDSIVTPDRTRRLAYKLDADLICIPDHGHFLGSRGMETFPELLELILTA